MVVERFDLFGDGEVLICDGLVGDPGVDHGHRERLVAEQRGDGFDAHAPVDGLGGQGVAELVGGDVTDAGVDGDAAEGVGDTQFGDGPAVLEQKPFAAQAGRPIVRDPVVEEVLELGGQGNVAVVVELPDGNPQPVGRTDLHDGVDGEAE